MSWKTFFGRRDDDNHEDFVDADSSIPYESLSRDETLDKAASHRERGNSVDLRDENGVNMDRSEEKRLPERARFNTTELESDDQGNYYHERNSADRKRKS